MRFSIRKGFRRALRSMVRLHGSPRDIALGAAIGIFVAFTPTIGFQMLIAAFLATLVGANRPAAIIPPWITNPITIPPIYGLTYWLGTFFHPGPSVAEVYRRLVAVVASIGQLSLYAFHRRLGELLTVGADVFIAMTIGGVLVGLFCGGLTYPLVLWAVTRYRRRRQRRRMLRVLQRADRRRRAADGARGRARPGALDSGAPPMDSTR